MPPFPYCLKCHSEDPGHSSDKCPYMCTYCWCWSIYHIHVQCLSPHLACSTTKCIVLLYYANIRTICATSLVSNDNSYKLCIATGDYNSNLEGFVTD